MTDVWWVYKWDICAFPENTFYREVFIMAVHNPQYTISFCIFKNDLLPNCLVKKFVRKPGVEGWMSVDDMDSSWDCVKIGIVTVWCLEKGKWLRRRWWRRNVRWCNMEVRVRMQTTSIDRQWIVEGQTMVLVRNRRTKEWSYSDLKEKRRCVMREWGRWRWRWRWLWANKNDCCGTPKFQAAASVKSWEYCSKFWRIWRGSVCYMAKKKKA